MHLNNKLEFGLSFLINTNYPDFHKMSFPEHRFNGAPKLFNIFSAFQRAVLKLYAVTKRKQALVVNGTKSMPADVKSGVPHGSVLGPLLFLVLICDIDREVATAFVSSFADGTRAANGISTNADVCDLQVDLDVIYHWADENTME